MSGFLKKGGGKMKVDLYVRVVLTVIAVCLVWLCLGKVEVVQEAEAHLSSGSIGRYQLVIGHERDEVVLVDTEKGEIWHPKGDPEKDKWAKKRIVR